MSIRSYSFRVSRYAIYRSNLATFSALTNFKVSINSIRSAADGSSSVIFKSVVVGDISAVVTALVALIFSTPVIIFKV